MPGFAIPQSTHNLKLIARVLCSSFLLSLPLTWCVVELFLLQTISVVDGPDDDLVDAAVTK